MPIPKEAEWKLMYGLHVTLKTKDAAAAKSAITEDVTFARTQSYATRSSGLVRPGTSMHFSLLGTNTTGSGGYPPAPLEADKAVWVEQWESKEEFEALPYVAPGMPKSSARAHVAALVPDLGERLATGSVVEDLTIIEGPMWHIEKPMQGQGGPAYTIDLTWRCKSVEAAMAVVEAHKKQGLAQLEKEPGALRYTVVPPVGDNTTVRWIAGFTDLAAHNSHAKDYDYAEIGVAKLMVASAKSSPAADGACREYADATHMQRFVSKY